MFEIQLCRPLSKNAISLSMYASLVDALEQFERNETLQVAVIYGDEQCFTAGNDLADFLAGGELNPSHPTVKFLFLLASLQKPIIAAVAGPAIGIGTTMLLHCDMVFSAKNTVFQLPFAQLGLCPEAASSLLVPQLVGHQKAFSLLVLGQKFDANVGQQLGFVNQITENEDVISSALACAKTLSNLPLPAVISSKVLLKNSNKQQIEDTIKLELEHFSRLLSSDDCKNIINQFFQK